ncbi:hypothetical protein AVEN_42177-1 [Araneus ventricosus]|uniref:Uncharacterized protein n=1 Tax=Araneus ventricosus TaxID=182803 RepID=A0A4Y2AXW9_ARAVE|nr:hypothetical protein AVEN_42177-1 [Araneus ventricosus]
MRVLVVRGRTWGFVVARNPTSDNVATTRTQPTIFRRNCAEASVHLLAGFDVRGFIDISPERSRHPKSLQAKTNHCIPTTGDKTYFLQRQEASDECI